MEESEYILQTQAGNSRGFAVLFQRYQVRIFRTAYLITQDKHLAEDLTQGAFVRAFRSISKCDPERPFLPWLLRIVINLCRTAVQRRGRQVTVADVPEHSAADPGFAEVEARVQVWQMLQQLSSTHREVLLLRYYHDLTDAEIAEALDIPLGTAKSRLHMARRQLDLHGAAKTGFLAKEATT